MFESALSKNIIFSKYSDRFTLQEIWCWKHSGWLQNLLYVISSNTEGSYNSFSCSSSLETQLPFVSQSMTYSSEIKRYYYQLFYHEKWQCYFSQSNIISKNILLQIAYWSGFFLSSLLKIQDGNEKYSQLFISSEKVPKDRLIELKVLFFKFPPWKSLRHLCHQRHTIIL